MCLCCSTMSRDELLAHLGQVVSLLDVEGIPADLVTVCDRAVEFRGKLESITGASPVVLHCNVLTQFLRSTAQCLLLSNPRHIELY